MNKTKLALSAVLSLISTQAPSECQLLPGNESKCPGAHPGFATIQNRLAYNNIHGQSVILIAPSVGNNNTWKWIACDASVITPAPQCQPPIPSTATAWAGGYSAFLNNAVTDGNYFLQVGFSFTNRDFITGNRPLPTKDCQNIPVNDPGNPFSPEGAGYVVFAGGKIEEGASAPPSKALCVPYISGHHYYTTISFTSGMWWTCAADLQVPSTYRCQPHPEAKGSGTGRLINHPSRGTNVFAENWNKDPAWTQGFPYQWVAYGAKIYVDGIGYPWSSEDKWTQNSCDDKSWPPNQAIVSSSGLVNDGYAFFNTGYLPLYCDD